jgi:hypothetical protein
MLPLAPILARIALVGSKRIGIEAVETTKNASSILPLDWPRSIVNAPESFNGRQLTQAELDTWAKLEDQFAPFVIGDEIGNNKEPLPTPLSTAWSSLYSSAIYFMAATAKQIQITPDVPRPRGLEWASWSMLLTEFWKRREQQIHAFYKFLNDWELGETLGIPASNFEINNEAKTQIPYDDDRKVLGLHRFQSWEEVAEYALRWARNPLIRDTHLWQHRLTISRGIDLISSELVANGFEHGGKKDAEVFIMAKLCSRSSAWRALELDKKTPYLTQAEKHCFTLAVEQHCSILQLCIGDSGQGFGGNKALKKNYSENQNDNYNELKLISFALSGKVSTKTREHHRSYWNKHLAGDTEVAPTVHGLAEVRRFVRKMHGYWRIHSNATILDQSFLNQLPDKDNTSLEDSTMDARPIPGCLHYFMFPLLPEENLPTIRYAGHKIEGQRFHLIDSADDVLRQNHGNHTPQAEHWVGSFCNRIINAQETHRSPVLLRLETFDQLNERDLEDACIDLARCLRHVRDDLAVFTSGASEKTRYHLFRYSALSTFDQEYRVLPFLDFQSPSQINLQLYCSEIVGSIKDDLMRILMGGNEILKSDNSKRWELFRRIHTENQGLFKISPISTAGDEAFQARVELTSHDQKAMALLYGGMAFTEMADHLLRHQAIASSNDGFWRLGNKLPVYVHIGRLWANADFQLRVTNWLRIAFLQAQAVPAAINKDSGDLILLAVLHPAIELAHELIRWPQFASAEIIEIRRVSELRWDFEPFLKVRGRKVAILIDMVLTGDTVRRIIDIINYVGLETWACFSILSIENSTGGIQEYSFCQCAKNDLQLLVKKKLKGK